MNIDNCIAAGQRVTFDDDQDGPQRGTVAAIMPDLSNGRRTAWIEVDHALPGVMRNVPLDILQPLTSEKMH